jgi:hypothetical protein
MGPAAHSLEGGTPREASLKKPAIDKPTGMGDPPVAHGMRSRRIWKSPDLCETERSSIPVGSPMADSLKSPAAVQPQKVQPGQEASATSRNKFVRKIGTKTLKPVETQRKQSETTAKPKKTEEIHDPWADPSNYGGSCHRGVTVQPRTSLSRAVSARHFAARRPRPGKTPRHRGAARGGAPWLGAKII